MFFSLINSICLCIFALSTWFFFFFVFFFFSFHAWWQFSKKKLAQRKEKWTPVCQSKNALILRCRWPPPFPPWGIERFLGVKYNYRVIIMLFCLHQSDLEPRLTKELDLMISIVFNVLSVLIYGPLFSFLLFKNILLIKYFKVIFYVTVHVYLIWRGSVAKFIIPSTQQVHAARFGTVPKVTCLPKQAKVYFHKTYL